MKTSSLSSPGELSGVAQATSFWSTVPSFPRTQGGSYYGRICFQKAYNGLGGQKHKHKKKCMVMEDSGESTNCRRDEACWDRISEEEGLKTALGFAEWQGFECTREERKGAAFKEHLLSVRDCGGHSPYNRVLLTQHPSEEVGMLNLCFTDGLMLLQEVTLFISGRNQI